MKLEGRFTVKAPIDKVWDTLLNPETLAVCIPGCEKMEAVDDKTYDSVVKAKVGPIGVTFKFTTNLVELDRPRRMKAKGSGEEVHKAGTFNHEMVVDLKELSKGETEVTYSTNINIVGRLATFGDRIMRAKAKQLEGEFTEALREKLSKAT